jgi:hypothetical protein
MRLGVNVMAKSKKKQSKERNSLDALYRKRDMALDRVVATLGKYGATSGEPEELNKVLDALTVAHIAATFEWASGSLNE